VGTGDPQDDDYTRVTDPGRFAVLHEAAERLLDELTDQYTVERRESKEPLGGTGEFVRTVRLIPRMPSAAPLAVAFTDFPGVVLRLGRWHEESLPRCGCDACDEQPDDLIGEMRTQVGALIEGGLWERVRRGVTGSWSEARLIGPDVNASRATLLDARTARAARRDGFAAPVQWAPWPRRSPGNDQGV
jgi:hypothetical protein